MKRTILLVDDDASLLATLGDFLASEGYEMALAESGEAAMRLLRGGLSPDLIVLDMSMPGMGGMGFLERMGNRDGSFRYPVLVLTARAMMAEYFANKQVDGFIAKPCDPEDLAMEISRILFQRGRDPLQMRQKSPEVTTLLLGEPDAAKGELLREALQKMGFAVTIFAKGAQLLESAILEPPALIITRLELEEQSADLLVALLRRMGQTKNVPIIVYGIGSNDAVIEHVAALDMGECTAVSADTVEAIVDAACKAR